MERICPRGCPYPKGEDGACDYHRVMFEEAAKVEVITSHLRLAAVIDGKTPFFHFHRQNRKGKSSREE